MAAGFPELPSVNVRGCALRMIRANEALHVVPVPHIVTQDEYVARVEAFLREELAVLGETAFRGKYQVYMTKEGEPA